MPRSVHKPVNVSLPAIGPLPSIPGHKAPRPALPRPLYISAYTQPSTYAEYIKTVLSTPLTGSNVGCSSVDPMLDSAAMAHIRKEKGLQFADLITHELNMAIPHARDLWVRNTICGEAVPPDFEKHFRAHCKAWDDSLNGSYKGLPGPSMFTEAKIMEWLDSVSKELATAFGHSSSRRSWSNRTANSAPTGSIWQSRKPDLSLVDTEIVTSFSKKEVNGPGQLSKHSPKSPRTLRILFRLWCTISSRKPTSCSRRNPTGDLFLPLVSFVSTQTSLSGHLFSSTDPVSYRPCVLSTVVWAG